MLASFKVMNNRDLRRIIFSFFLSKYCEKCKKSITNHEYLSFSDSYICFPCFAIGYRKIIEMNKKYYLRKYKLI